MSSMQRNISGPVLVQHLDQASRSIDADLLAVRGRSARTLVKEGPLRLTIMALGPGGELAPHATDDTVSIHVVEGDVTFVAVNDVYPLVCDDILVLAPGVEHAARSTLGCVFLLSVVHEERSLEGTSSSRGVLRHPISESAKQQWAGGGADTLVIAKALDQHLS